MMSKATSSKSTRYNWHLRPDPPSGDGFAFEHSGTHPAWCDPDATLDDLLAVTEEDDLLSLTAGACYRLETTTCEFQGRFMHPVTTAIREYILQPDGTWKGKTDDHCSLPLKAGATSEL